jgi:thioredoxin-related protein
MIKREVMNMKKHKYVLFYATWCPCCKPVRIKLKDDKEVLMINGESDEGSILAEKFKVKAYPTMIDLKTKKEIRNIEKFIRRKRR